MYKCELCECELGDGWCSTCAAEANAIGQEAREATMDDLIFRLSLRSDPDSRDASLAIERLRSTLSWYESELSNVRKITPEGDKARRALDRDGGARARAALGMTE